MGKNSQRWIGDRPFSIRRHKTESRKTLTGENLSFWLKSEASVAAGSNPTTMPGKKEANEKDCQCLGCFASRVTLSRSSDSSLLLSHGLVLLSAVTGPAELACGCIADSMRVIWSSFSLNRVFNEDNSVCNLACAVYIVRYH